MVHIDKKHYNPDGPRNYPDSWPPRSKDGFQPCHDAGIPVLFRGVCSLPIFHTEAECGLNGGLWDWHQDWNPGKPPCCGGLDFNGAVQPPCSCGECKGEDCRECSHECRSIIGRYPFAPIGGTSCAPKYLDLIWGCSTKEGCSNRPESNLGKPWVEGGCDCCGPCCSSMIGREDLYEHKTTEMLKMGYCAPLETHGHLSEGACKSTVVSGSVGYWVDTSEAVSSASLGSSGQQGGVCFKGHQDLPFGTRYVMDGSSESSCVNAGNTWVASTPLPSRPAGCIPPNSCGDNCGGRQVGTCKDSSGDIQWGVTESGCTGSNTWSVDECVNQPPCCYKYGGILSAKSGFEKLSFTMTGCAAKGGIVETDLYWAGGGPMPINISPWEKFGGMNPFKEVRISGDIIDEARMAGQGLAIIGSQGGAPSTINIENTCGVWIGGFTTCEACGVWKPNFDVVCPGCNYMAHPIMAGGDLTCETCGYPPYADPSDPSLGSSEQFPGPDGCVDFPAIQPANTCVYKNMTLLPACYDFIGDPARGIMPGGSDKSCQECCSENWLPPKGNCCGRCVSFGDAGGTGGQTGGASGSAGSGPDESGGGGLYGGGGSGASGSGSGPGGDGSDLDPGSGATDGTPGGSPGMPGNQSPGPQGNACHQEAFDCTQTGGTWILNSGADGKRCGSPLTGYRGCSTDPPRVVVDDCGNSKCVQYATVHPGACCADPGLESPTCSDAKYPTQTSCEKAGQYWGMYHGGCRQNIKRGQKCEGGHCDCCEFCPSCTRTVSYGSNNEKIITAGDRSDVCHLPLGMASGAGGGNPEYGLIMGGCGVDVEGCSSGMFCKATCNGESPIGKRPGEKCICPTCPILTNQQDPCYSPCKDGVNVGGRCIWGELKKSQQGNMPPASLCGFAVAGLKYHPGHPPEHLYKDGGACKVWCNNVGGAYWADRLLACNDEVVVDDGNPGGSQPLPGSGDDNGSGGGGGVGDDGGAAGQGGHGSSPDDGGGGQGGGDDGGGGAEGGDFDGGIGGGEGGSGYSSIVNMCVGCGELASRIQPCAGGNDGMGKSCGCGSIDWTDRCQQDFSALSPEANFVNVLLICRQEGSCKEDCDNQAFSRFRRHTCDKGRCGAAHGATVCKGEGSEWIPPDPPWPGNDRVFRWGAVDIGGSGDDPEGTGADLGGGGGGLPSYPVWGDPKECPCEEVPPGGCDKCARPSPGEVECMGATGMCVGGPQYTDWHPKVPLCQNWFVGTDRNACGHEWFTPPWGYPPVCGSNCGTDGQHPNQTPPVPKENLPLKENPEPGVCYWPSPIPPPRGGFSPGDCELACCDVISDCGNNAKEREVNVLKVGECKDSNLANPKWTNKYQCKAAGKCYDGSGNEETGFLNDKTSCLRTNNQFKANSYRFDDNSLRCFNVDNVEINHYLNKKDKCLNAKCFDEHDNELPQYNDNQEACFLNNYSWKSTATWEGEVIDPNPTAYKCVKGYDLGRCSCDPEYWRLTRDECDELRRSPNAPQAVVDKGWIANGWEPTGGACYQRGTTLRIYGDEAWVPDCNNYVPQPDYLKSDSACIGVGECTNECLGTCSGLGSGIVCDGWGTGGDCCKEECTAKNGNWAQRHNYSECASWWSTVWAPHDDPYWYDTEFAMANQEAAGILWTPPHAWYEPKHIELLGYEWGGLGDGCYDGCMSGAVPPFSCSAGSGGGGGLPRSLGFCSSCDGWEWDIPKDVCVSKIRACTGMDIPASVGKAAWCEGATPPAGFGDYGGILTKKQCTTFGGTWHKPEITTRQPGGTGTPTGGDDGSGDIPSTPGTGGPGGGGPDLPPSGPGAAADQSDGYQWTPNPYRPQGGFAPDEICKGCLSCGGVGGDICGGCAGQFCQEQGSVSMNDTPPYCLSQRWCDEHPHVGDPCGKCGKSGCSDGGCGNYNPWNWRYRKCGNKCQHLELYVGGQKIVQGYSSGAIKKYGKIVGGKVVKGPPDCKLFGPDSCCPTTISLEHKDRPVPYVRVVSIDIKDGGEGYTEAPLITIDEPQFVTLANDGIQAVATAEIDEDKDSPTYQQIINVIIVKEGHGYADPHARRSSHIPSVTVLGGGLDENGNPTVTRTAVLEVNKYWGLEAYTGTCKGSWWNKPGAGFPGGPTPTPSDQRYKENPACGCIAFNDCVPGNPPQKQHFWKDYTCDDVYVETKEKFGNDVKSGNIVHIFNSTDKRRPFQGEVSAGLTKTVGTPRWINGDFQLHRISGTVNNIFRLGCSGRKASAKDTGCEAGYCHDCKDGDKCPGNEWKDCCAEPIAAYPYGGTTRKNRCIEERKGPCGASAASSWPGCWAGECKGGCGGEWFEGDCKDSIVNCTEGCGPDGKCSNDGDCISGKTGASVYVSKGKCKCTGGFGVTSTLTIEQYEEEYPEPLPIAGGSGWTQGAGPYAWFIGDEVRVMESCPGGELPDLGGAQCTDRVNGVLRTEQEMEECIAAQQDACLKQPATCWEAAKKCGEKCCQCIDCSYEKGVGAACPDCCWEDDGQGNIIRCEECPDACPVSPDECCADDCPRIDGIYDIDLSMGYRSGVPIMHPQLTTGNWPGGGELGYPCANPNYPEWNGGLGGTPKNVRDDISLTGCKNSLAAGYSSTGCQFSWDEANDPCPDEGSCSGKKAVVVQEDGEWKIKQVVVGVGGTDKCDCETGGYCNGSVDPIGYECTDSSYTNETDCKAALGNIGWKPQLDGEPCVAGAESWSFEGRTGGSGPAAGIKCSDVDGLLANTSFKTEQECCDNAEAAPDGSKPQFINHGAPECGACRGLWNGSTGICMYSAGLNRGATSCEPCTGVLGGEWDEYNGVCKNVQGVKAIPCSRNFHTYWRPQCCEEKDCVQDTCKGEPDNDGNCCGYWATSACNCPDLVKDCDGKQIYHVDTNGNPILSKPKRQPFMIDIEDSLHIGGCCGKWIVGSDGIDAPPFSFPETHHRNRIIITESS